MINGMNIVRNGLVIATVSRNEFGYRWKVSGRVSTIDATSPTGMRIAAFVSFRRTINEIYDVIRSLYPGATITYIKSGSKRIAA